MKNELQKELNWEKAEEQRKAGRFTESFSFFIEEFQKNNDESSLWRAIHCARHLKKFKEALELIETGLKLFPDSLYISTQFNWLKYDFQLHDAKKRCDWEAVLDISRDILSVNPEGILFNLCLFAAIDAAKNLKQFSTLLELTDSILPENLSATSETYKGRKMMSWRERWYFARVSCLYEMELWQETRKLAFQALKDFPTKVEFRRKAALSLIGLNRQNEAIEELTAICRLSITPWYIFADLAKLHFESGNFEDAFRYAETSVNKRGEIKTKVNLFALMARVLLAMGEKTELAEELVRLSLAIREQNHWKINPELQTLMDRFEIAEESRDPRLIAKNVFSNFNSTTVHSSGDDKSLVASDCKGKLILKKPDAPYAFISSPEFKENIYAKSSDIPSEVFVDGASVLFNVIENFDHKKQKNSTRAVQIRAF